jgi:hypothetical protein
VIGGLDTEVDWVAIGALGTWLAAIGTIGTLIFFWLQLQAMREGLNAERKRAEDAFRQEHTPFLSIALREFVVNPRPEAWAHFTLHADGQGVAYNVIVNMVIEPGSPPGWTGTHVVSFLRAPDSETVSFSWDIKPGSRPAWLEIRFTNMFEQSVAWKLEQWSTQAA